MELSDEKLFQLCKEYGSRALLWRQKFIGLLPEVNRRGLYKKKGFSSVFEFAARLAGVSREQVERVLGLERKFEHLPMLKKMLVNGEASVNKLARVSSIANSENQEFLADQSKLLSKSALETLVRDEKFSRDQVVPGHGTYSSHGNNDNVKSDQKIKFQFDGNELQLSDEVRQKLLELQNKGIDVNDLILEFLEKRQQEIVQEKERLAVQEQQKLGHLQKIWKDDHVKTSRHIPVKIQKIIQKEHGTKCSVPTCKKLATAIHHSNRFSISKIHDPRFMSPFCHEHHQIAHSVDQKYQEKRISLTE